MAANGNGKNNTQIPALLHEWAVASFPSPAAYTRVPPGEKWLLDLRKLRMEISRQRRSCLSSEQSCYGRLHTKIFLAECELNIRRQSLETMGVTETRTEISMELIARADVGGLMAFCFLAMKFGGTLVQPTLVIPEICTNMRSEDGQFLIRVFRRR